MTSSLLLRSVTKRPVVSLAHGSYNYVPFFRRRIKPASFSTTSFLTGAFTSSSSHNFGDTTHHEQTKENNDAAADRPQSFRKGYGQGGVSLFDMDAFQIRGIKTVKEAETLVRQLEQLPKLVAADIGPLLVPLSRKAALINDASPLQAALLTERILFACLKQLPSSLDARTADSPYPDVALYNRTIIAWGSTKTMEGAERADRILQLMIAEYKNDPLRAAAPDRRCYKSTVRAWAVAKPHAGSKHTVGQGTERAYALLQEMEDLSGVSELLRQLAADPAAVLSRHDFRIDPPDRMAYNSVMASYAKGLVGNDTACLDRIKAIVARMDMLYALTDNPQYRLDGHSYHSLLRAYSRFVAYIPKLLPETCVYEIAAVIDRIHTENCIDELAALVDRAWIYGIVVEALLKTKPLDVNVSKAHDYVLALAGRPAAGSLDLPLPTDSSLWPRHATIMKMIRAWQKLDDHPDEKEKINELIDIAVDAPHARSFNLNEVMEEWIDTKFDFAPKVVELMLANAMERRYRTKAKPTGQSFLIAIKAWVRSSFDDAPHRAELILQNMLEIYLESNDRFYKPREQHLRLLITAWISRCETGRRYNGLAGMRYPAEHIEALLQCHQGCDWFDKNVTGLYALALRAWALQRVEDGPGEPNPIEHLGILLDHFRELQEDELLPAYPCNWVLEGCCRELDSVERRQEAYTLAVDTFRQSRRNARTFVLVVQAIKQQVRDLDETHVGVIESLFQECCSAGMLTQDMIWEVVRVSSADALRKLFGVSHQYATGIVQVRDGHLHTSDTGLQWKGALPNALRCENLPFTWRANASTGLKVR